MQKLSVIICLLTLVSCGDRLTQKDLIGVYGSNFLTPADSIYLYTDSVYTYKYYSSDGRLFESSGTWYFDGYRLTFNDFVFYNDNGPHTPPGFWIPIVKYERDRIKIVYAQELGHYYIKVQ